MCFCSDEGPGDANAAELSTAVHAQCPTLDREIAEQAIKCSHERIGMHVDSEAVCLAHAQGRVQQLLVLVFKLSSAMLATGSHDFHDCPHALC